MEKNVNYSKTIGIISLVLVLFACGDEAQPPSQSQPIAEEAEVTRSGEDWQPAVKHEPDSVVGADGFVRQTERFADIQVLRYKVPGWDKLSLRQKQLVYYLNQAGMAGRDIMWDQNYRHNIEIRKLLESIYTQYKGDRNTRGWQRFETYLKRIWFANGIHHHYSNAKFQPEFSKQYFAEIAAESGVDVRSEILDVIFNPDIDAKKVELDPGKGLLENSAVNFYAPDVTTADAEAFYRQKIDPADTTPVSYGLNSRLAKNSEGEVYEQVWKLDGMYGDAIAGIIGWLEKAISVAENDQQAGAFEKLIEYYRTGDLKAWDEYNILWVNTVGGDIDYINGFVEVYNDPLGYRGSYENVVQIKDFDNSARMKVLMDNAEWFEGSSPIMDRHRREDVVGIVYNVVNVAGETGDASPSTPVGINLPNANWIRSSYGSKSVSLGNIEEAYRESSGTILIDEFANDEQEKEWYREYGSIVSPLSTALHEVIGHASGKLEPGVGTPKETLKNYSSTIEEGRADLMSLYFITDPKMVEMGLLPSMDAGRYAYDRYLRNGLLQQLRRIEPGADIEEAHMRNRAWISHWVFEKGMPDNVIAEIKRDGKTYYDVRDYEKLRELIGQLLREVQRIKSQGDFEAARDLVENYGVKVDPELHREVLDRAEKLDIAPYGGFINPILEPVLDSEGNIVDIELDYVDDFAEQMLYYSEHYGYL